MKIHRLRIPTPFPVGPVNVTLLAEDPITLVDTGPRTDEAFAALREQVRACGFSLEQIRRIVLTHSHEDHAGQAARLQALSGATVYAHPWEVERLRPTFDYAAYRHLLAELGVPEEVIAQFEVLRWKLRELIAPISEVALLEDGDELPFERESWRVVHTPGHTPGHIGLFSPSRRILIAGDTVLKHITPNPVLNPDPRDGHRRFPSLRRFLMSVDQLRDLAPTLVVTGHGEEVDDFETYWRDIHRHVRQRQEAMRAALGTQALTPWELSLRLFPDARADQRFLALSETIAHLDFALAEGAVQCERRDGIEFYRWASWSIPTGS
ncbi:MAG: MBL fold metallo-hydrolase [Blastocatellia bacterium]|nr:MBL fold metallo-hydrolase [Blastocatellia bacterium]MCX7751899.1 MBL fold metallo-hydrolase [Blastocatellia bacterium]MDW8167005.1 MBL fold metallo-hydrolase [Acidobacteriota bacterium]MDW8257109.1 MBL fold metallo-hydrolase [Acidobacteriota bacterium]